MGIKCCFASENEIVINELTKMCIEEAGTANVQ